MALDTGPMDSAFNGPHMSAGPDLFPRPLPAAAVVTVESLAFAPGVTFGAGLKAARQFLGLELRHVADATKIRSQYLDALEAMDLGQLPSRPFILGYVRAYARVLGLDEDQAIVRFRQDAPDPNEPLRAPVGVPKEADPRFGLLGAAAGIVIVAIVAWNVAQRAMTEHDTHPAKEAAATVADTATGPVQLGKALPVPQESTLPDPYITPGLAPAVTGVDPVPVQSGPIEPPAEVRAFVTAGAVYGASAAQSQILIQAQRGGSLIARSGDGKVYFAQQLKGGEAYRVPMLPGLLIDVSSPHAMDVFVGGVLAGNLVQPVTPLSALSKLVPPPPPPATLAPPVQPSAATAPAPSLQETPALAPAR